MRGGKIFVRDDTGYRAGIHMKAYEEKKPVLVIGGKAGSFLGEYQPGGIIIVLGLNEENRPPVGRFCGTGMHGGKIYLRCDTLPEDLPEQVLASEATPEDQRSHRGVLHRVFLFNGQNYGEKILCTGAKQQKSLQTALHLQLKCYMMKPEKGGCML